MLPCGFPHTDQRLGHVFPDLRPARALLSRVPLGPRPSLHCLRRWLPGFVRQLRRSHEGRVGQGRCSGIRRHAQSFLSRFSIQGLSPVARPGGAVSPRRSKLTYGRRSVSAAPTSRLRAVRTQGDVTSLQYGIESHATNRFVRLGLPGMISFPRQMRSLSYLRSDQTAFMTAPSITTPAVTYFHNATSSFRAKAMIVALRRLSVLVRSRNHLLSADSG